MKITKLILGAAGLFLAAFTAHSQPHPNAWVPLTNSMVVGAAGLWNGSNVTTITAAKASNIVNSGAAPQAIQIRPGCGFGITASYSGHANNTNSIDVYCYLSVDGTNWCNTTPLIARLPVGAAGPCFGYTNFPAALCEGARFAGAFIITNGNGNNLSVTNCWITRSTP